MLVPNNLQLRHLYSLPEQIGQGNSQRGTITPLIMPKIDGISITYLKGKERREFFPSF